MHEAVFLVSLLSLLSSMFARVGHAGHTGDTARTNLDENAVDEAVADGELDVEDSVGGPAVEDGVGRPDVEELVRGGARLVARSAPGGHAWLSLVGYSLPTASGVRDSGGLVVVGFPFDRLARVVSRGDGRGAPAITAGPAPPSPRDAQGRTATPTPLPPPSAAGASGSAPLPNAEPPPRTRRQAVLVTPRVARACVVAAWRASSLGPDDARLDAIVARSRLSGVLPETRLRVIRWDGAHVYADLPTDTTTSRDSLTASLGLEARLTWRLDRLLFAEDEPSFERIRLERQDARAKVAGHALEALFHWQRAVADLGEAETDLRAESAELRVAEAEATLDVLTDGWFSTWRVRFRPTREAEVTR